MQFYWQQEIMYRIAVLFFEPAESEDFEPNEIMEIFHLNL